MVFCLDQGADAYRMAQLMPLPLTVSSFSKIQIGLTFLVPAHLGSPGKGLLNGCVCVFVDVAGVSDAGPETTGAPMNGSNGDRMMTNDRGGVVVYGEREGAGDASNAMEKVVGLHAENVVGGYDEMKASSEELSA